MVSNAKRKEERDRAISGSPEGDVGRALKSVYEKAVEEQIPPEMLDLLGKLK